MVDRYNQHDETVILDRRNNPIVPDAIAPKSFVVSGQRMSEAVRVVRRAMRSRK
jgi:hypothetical protein